MLDLQKAVIALHNKCRCCPDAQPAILCSGLLLIPGKAGTGGSIERRTLLCPIPSTSCQAAAKGQKEKKRKLQDKFKVRDCTRERKHTVEKRAQTVSTVKIRRAQPQAQLQ